jgi:hypothetical protein
MLVTSIDGNRIGLASVLGNVRVDKVHNVWADGGGKHKRHGGGASLLSVYTEYIDLRAGGHD